MNRDLIKQLFADNNGSWLVCKPILKKSGIIVSLEDAYDIVHDILPKDKIAPCGKPKILKKFTIGYQLCGSTHICQCARDGAALNRRKTNLTKYGTEQPLSLISVRNKRKDTMIERHGTEHALQTEISKEKLKQTNREKYGVDYITKLDYINKKGRDNISENKDIVSAKRKETNIARYGFEQPAKSDIIKQRSIDTNLKRYGVNHPSMLSDNRASARNTSMERYGVDYAFKHSMFKDKAQYTSMERYGVAYPAQSHIPIDTIKILSDPDGLKDLLSTNSLNGMADILKVHPTTIGRYCRKHGIPVPRSTYENEISTFLENLNVSFISNDRRLIGPREVDFYLPDHKLAIEFNGLYWHSDAIQDDRFYHWKKMNDVRTSGNRLLTIFEDEWIERSNIVKGKIINILGRSPKGTVARKLDVRRIKTLEANDFFDHHHLQGRTGNIMSSMGAYDGDVLVAAMGFNKQRMTGSIELIRFCSSGSTHAGIFSRMFKHSVDAFGYNEVISFADLRYSDGGVYNSNGFEFVSEIKPDYKYIIGNKTFHKRSFTKDNIAKKFGLDMTSLTEREAMTHLGIPRIYDCGKIKYLWKK